MPRPPVSPAPPPRLLSRRAALGALGAIVAGVAGTTAFPRWAAALGTAGSGGAHAHCGGGTTGAAAAVEHPTPRPGITAERILPDEQVKERSRAVYAKAREIPEILDGIYCHCECAKRHDLHSLLDCFASKMAAGCGICSGEAALAHRLHGEGKTLDEIRAAIDERYGE